jgi:hypothetical protein
MVAYQTEHYLEQLDGSYVLAETEVPLYGKIGATVTATAKSYEHYHVNTTESVDSGVVTRPTEVDGNIQYLTLKVYYDLDTVTVTYDPDNGEASSSETLKYGAAETVHAAPTRDGYTFQAGATGRTSISPKMSLPQLRM